ncbi:Ribonuclease VapC9 [Candidatus Bilamarchaeum dharawalense]|uniref:Ribonuclease VapC9 n=1 Tax=Candidatus Bilamarchaeum dharawalense TaxID=2885759 RepID=A0A5E4LRS4_9ARCH|nr:Ribonuclease VapC9 [Candidatus Bilamarchaeum dharawalense]
MPPRPVILDTNFLLIPFQFKIDIFRELEYLIEVSHSYVISSKTIKELQKLGKLIGKNGMAARLALKLVIANEKKIETVESQEYVDDWIVDYAQKNNAIVCTNDSELRKRLRRLDIKVITMKSKSKLGYV